MTTIAYRDGVLAADSMCSTNGTYLASVDKIHRLDDGRIVGLCGQSGVCRMVVNWLNGGEKPVLAADDNLNAIIVNPDGGLALLDKHLVLIPCRAPFLADGSGREIALGAMAAGATAEHAVEIACRFDNGSFLPVQSLTIGA